MMFFELFLLLPWVRSKGLGCIRLRWAEICLRKGEGSGWLLGRSLWKSFRRGLMESWCRSFAVWAWSFIGLLGHRQTLIDFIPVLVTNLRVYLEMVSNQNLNSEVSNLITEASANLILQTCKMSKFHLLDKQYTA